MFNSGSQTLTPCPQSLIKKNVWWFHSGISYYNASLLLKDKFLSFFPIHYITRTHIPFFIFQFFQEEQNPTSVLPKLIEKYIKKTY